MNKLIDAMSSDMNIFPYTYESDCSFIYRVVYSGLGMWCLKSALDVNGITKHAQTSLLNDLIKNFIHIYPCLEEFLVQSENMTPISVFIRRIYEETGYLLTDDSNKNKISSYGERIQIDSKFLSFGLESDISMEGLGVFSSKSKIVVPWQQLFIRDKINCEDFINSNFDIVDFDERDLSTSTLSFFNPNSNKSPSSSWSNTLFTDKSIAFDQTTNQYYKVLTHNQKHFFCEEEPNPATDKLLSFDYRRLYLALKKFYGNPLITFIKKLDENYSKIYLRGHLPNREYYLLLLCSWPEKSYLDKSNFIIKNENLSFIKSVLQNLGIEIKQEA